MPKVVRDSRLYDWWADFRQWQEYRRWDRGGRGEEIPHLRKRAILREYAARHGSRTLVETGTYLGFMVRAMRPHFDRIYSMELNEALYQRAARRFRGDPRIEILQGDSEVVLPTVVARLDAPALFWLDAHWSGDVTARAARDTPIMHELQTILTHRLAARHVMLIDDALSFPSKDYPSIVEVEALVAKHQPTLRVEVRENIIRITPRVADGAAAAGAR